MRYDFYELQTKIQNYLTAEHAPLAESLYGLPAFEKSIMSFPNALAERSGKVLYFDFDKYSFEVLTLESYCLKGELDLYLTLRGTAPPQTMTEEMAKYVGVFFHLIDSDETLGALVDMAVVDEIEFYEHAEGNAHYKAALLKIRFEKEC